MNKPELIFFSGRRLFEALWPDKRNHLIYFVAIRDNLIYALNPESGDVRTYRTEGPVGGVIPSGNGNLWEAEKSGIYSLNPRTGDKTLFHHLLPYPTMRYNHLIMDSRGRILVDVMGDENRHAGEGGLYIIDGVCIRCLIPNTTVANGVALSDDETKLYFTDTPTKTVWEYSYDISSGTISNQRVVIAFPKDDAGLPDGVMVGKHNDLWIAEWASGKLSRWDIDSGKKIEEICFPGTHVTSTCFGGENNEFIYIATAKRDDTAELPGGAIYRLRVED